MRLPPRACAVNGRLQAVGDGHHCSRRDGAIGTAIQSHRHQGRQQQLGTWWRRSGQGPFPDHRYDLSARSDQGWYRCQQVRPGDMLSPSGSGAGRVLHSDERSGARRTKAAIRAVYPNYDFSKPPPLDYHGGGGAVPQPPPRLPAPRSTRPRPRRRSPMRSRAARERTARA